MSTRDADIYRRARYDRALVPPAQVGAMLKSQFYLGAGFVGASIATVALRLLVTSGASRFNTYELGVAALVGAAFAAFAWLRATRLLDSATAGVVNARSASVDPVPQALVTLSGR